MTNQTQRTLKDTMSIGRKIGLLLDYLQNGGEVTVNGRVWVWCDNVVTHETTDRKGNPQYWGIDGLAIKGVRISGNEEKPHYMGQNDIPFASFIALVEELSEEDWLGICASNALQSMNKKR